MWIQLCVAFGVVACSGVGCGGDRPTPDSSKLACPDGVPPALAPAADQDLMLTLRGDGVQHYACTSGVWTLVGPEAKLFDGTKPAGTHEAGPVWQHSDGSRVVGRKVASATVDPTAIPWLLLAVFDRDPAPGAFADVTTIQRLSTTGGLAPATACDAGAKLDVPYSATYYFYRPSVKPKPLRCGG
jgi:hypothetical protein